jgi:hypothetical protein
MKKLIISLFVKPFAAAVAGIAGILLLVHLLAGDKSPGLVGLVKLGMVYWIPLLFFVLFVLPSFYGIWLLIALRTQAKKCGHTISTFMSLPLEQRNELTQGAKPSKEN